MAEGILKISEGDEWQRIKTLNHCSSIHACEKVSLLFWIQWPWYLPSSSLSALLSLFCQLCFHFFFNFLFGFFSELLWFWPWSWVGDKTWLEESWICWRLKVSEGVCYAFEGCWGLVESWENVEVWLRVKKLVRGWRIL